MTLTLQHFYILSILARIPEAQLRTEDIIEELNAIGNVSFKFSPLSVKNSMTSLKKEGMIYIDYVFDDDIPDSEIQYAAISDEGID